MQPFSWLRFTVALLLSAAVLFPSPTFRSLNFTSTTSAPVPDFLWWQMNDNTGTTVTAAVGGNGTLQGSDAATSWTTGKAGSGVYTDNANRKGIQSNANVAFSSASIVTVCLWFKPASLPAYSFLYELSANATNSGYGRAFCVYIDNGKLQLVASDANGYPNTRVQMEEWAYGALDVWTHLAVIHNFTSGGSHKLYVDGDLKTLTETQTAFGGSTTVADDKFNLGSRDGGADRIANAAFDDIRIYSGELTVGQIAAVIADPK